MSETKYLMNAETREIYPYSKDLAEMTDPKFLPYKGEIPPPDLHRGVPLATDEMVAGVKAVDPDEERRVEIIAGIVHLVPKEEITEKGIPALLAVEKLSKLKDVKRKEVNAAMKLRADVMAGRTRDAREKQAIEEFEKAKEAEALAAETNPED
jgi:hypothetical protein